MTRETIIISNIEGKFSPNLAHQQSIWSLRTSYSEADFATDHAAQEHNAHEDARHAHAWHDWSESPSRRMGVRKRRLGCCNNCLVKDFEIASDNRMVYH
jgi:hypothetical protein